MPDLIAVNIPKDVDRYFKETKEGNPDYTDAQAWATAWSRFCKYKDPGSDHCKKPTSEYFPGKSASTKVVYAGVMLNDPEDLLSWWKREVGPLLPKKIAHHMTIKFAPSPEEVSALSVGDPVGLRVVGWADDGRVQAVVVRPEGVRSKNAIPHVTVATDGVAKPMESNALLESGYTEVSGPVLQGRVGLFVGNQDVFEWPLPSKSASRKELPIQVKHPERLDAAAHRVIRDFENGDISYKDLHHYMERKGYEPEPLYPSSPKTGGPLMLRRDYGSTKQASAKRVVARYLGSKGRG